MNVLESEFNEGQSAFANVQENQMAKRASILASFPRIPKHRLSSAALAVFVAYTSIFLSAQKTGQETGKERSMRQIFYRAVKVDGLSIFYREAGPKDAPVILLLHGLPSSSRMFEPLLARLSDSYHLAPDYPGFGHSDWPDPKQFAYTFDHIAAVMENFTQAIGLSRYTLYMQDYGGPVG